MPEMVKKVYELRGIPLWLLQEYLQELGGQPGANGWTTGPGWQACLTPMNDFQLGSLRVGQVRIEWQAEPEAHNIYWPKLEMKMMRAGG
jgi:hypothetical protein